MKYSMKHKFLLSTLSVSALCGVFAHPTSAQEVLPMPDAVAASNEVVIIEAQDVTDTTQVIAQEDLPLAETISANNNDLINRLPIIDQVMARVAMRNPEVLPSQLQTSFFTNDELALIKEAREGFNTSIPDGAGEDGLAPTGPRNVKLGGIIYLSKTDWAIWLNDVEVRPDAIPPEILDLRVRKELVELEWFDKQTNQIFPIRLRPNQVFNLDARLFLPG